MAAVVWSQAIGTVFLGLVGLWLAHNIRRQMRIKLAERQVDAYVQLWANTAAASPTRTAPLDEPERRSLCDVMDRWYFNEGNGVFMPRVTRNLFVAVQSNLVCRVGSIQPKTLADELTDMPAAEAERRRGCVAIRQLSLLRTQLKLDLSLHFGFNHLSHLHPTDRAFLRTCGISPRRRPWHQYLPRLLGRTSPKSCVCGSCYHQPIRAEPNSPADQHK